MLVVRIANFTRSLVKFATLTQQTGSSYSFKAKWTIFLDRFLLH